MKINKVVNFLQINLQHAKAATAELALRLSEIRNKGNSYVALVTEPWIVQGHVSGLNRYNPLYDRSGHPRAVICASRDLNPWVITKDLSPDLVTIEIILGRTKYRVSSAYSDINLNAGEHEVWNTASRDHIVGMDSNAHSSLWCDHSNLRGEQIEERIAEQGWLVANQGSTETFVSSRASSIIDITLSKGKGTKLVNNWRVDTSPSMSDHRYILWNSQKLLRPQERVRNLYRDNWSVFREVLEQKWRVGVNPLDHMTEEKMNRLVDKLYSEIEASLDISHPKQPTKKDRVPWWNEELDKQRKKMKRCNRTRTMDYTPPGALAETRIFKQMIAKAKKESWQKFCTEQETPKDLAQILKIVNKARAPEVGILRNDQGIFVDSPEESVKILLKAHFGAERIMDERSFLFRK